MSQMFLPARNVPESSERLYSIEDKKVGPPHVLVWLKPGMFTVIDNSQDVK